MVATTSGTVAATSIDAITLIEHAFRRCGKLPSTVSGEQLTAARESLFFLLSDLGNHGVNLWCIQKAIIALVPGTLLYQLPVGSIDVLSLAYRTNTALSGSTISGAGWQGVTFASASSPDNVQISFSTACQPSLVVEYNDGSTWITAVSFPVQQSQLVAGAAISVDIENTTSAVSWRVRDTSGTLPAVLTLTFNDSPSEIPMSPFNRDDYFSLPNKTFQASKSLQYWFDKQISPRVWLWPVPNTADQMVAEIHRQIQDVGSLTNLIAVPQRWFEYVIFALACRLAVELPKGELPEGRLDYLEQKAAFHETLAADSESDGSPMRLQPNLRGYTS